MKFCTRFLQQKCARFLPSSSLVLSWFARRNIYLHGMTVSVCACMCLGATFCPKKQTRTLLYLRILSSERRSHIDLHLLSAFPWSNAEVVVVCMMVTP
jgi:hypothetical protein